jgi:hypothetical protein
MYVVFALDDGLLEWQQFQRDGPTTIQRISLTEYMLPREATFNLLEGEKAKPTEQKKAGEAFKPITHYRNKIFVTILTDETSVSVPDIPPELARLIRVSHKGEFLPIIQNDILKTRLNDLEPVTKNTTEFQLQFNYSPVGIGKLRLIIHIENAIHQLKVFGFSQKDVDEVKGIFSDTNVYLLCGTIFIGSIHTLFDFLSFKNDVSFWRRKKNYAGLSVRSTLWRAFSQIVIFLYLFDEKTSMLVLVPSGIGAIIEIWKCKKILKLDISWRGIRPKVREDENALVQKAEDETRAFDREAMRYLSYILYPLCIGSAVYQLIYHPHKR